MKNRDIFLNIEKINYEAMFNEGDCIGCWVYVKFKEINEAFSTYFKTDKANKVFYTHLSNYYLSRSGKENSVETGFKRTKAAVYIAEKILKICGEKYKVAVPNLKDLNHKNL